MIVAYIVFIREIARKIRRLEIHRLTEIKRLERFGQIVGDFGGTVHRDMFKAHAAPAVDGIEARFGVIVAAVAPGAHLGGAIGNPGVGIGVEQPEGNIHALDFVNMVIGFERLGEQRFSLEVAGKGCFGGFLVQLEGNDVIRTQRAFEPSHHDDRVAAVGTVGRRGRVVTDNLAPAGIAHIHRHPLRVGTRPFVRRFVPFHLIGRSFTLTKHVVIIPKGIYFKFRLAEGTFHLLQAAVKFDLAPAAGTFVFHQIRHKHHTPNIRRSVKSVRRKNNRRGTL